MGPTDELKKSLGSEGSKLVFTQLTEWVIQAYELGTSFKQAQTKKQKLIIMYIYYINKNEQVCSLDLANKLVISL